jgi:hypothetical protein
LLGRDLEGNNGTAAVAVQRPAKHVSTTTELLFGKHIPAEVFIHATGETGVVYAVRTEELKRRELGQPVHLSYVREAVNIEPERVKLKNLHC